MLNIIYLIYKNGPIHFSKIHKLVLFLFLKILISPLVWIEHLLYNKRIVAHKIQKEPIFIIGHWRSGTTLLHQAISKDTGKSYLNFYQATFPGIFILTESLLKPILQKLVNMLAINIPYFNSIVFNWNFPCEEDTALLNMNSTSSAYWAYVFPRAAESWFTRSMLFTNSFNHTDENWKSDYREYLEKSLAIIIKENN